MSRRRRHPGRGTLPLALLLITAPSLLAAAGGSTLQATCHSNEVVVFSDGAQVWLVDGDREAMALPTDSRQTYRHLVAVEHGWLLAGERPMGDGLSELFVLRGSDGTRRESSTPFDPGTSRSGPQLLTHGGRLQGMVWLEGDDPHSLGVRFSQRAEDGWSPPTWVSAPGSSSQLALAAIVLGNGRWLAVWSAFDGTDDEVVYSHYADGIWSAPRRLSADNRVPDVTPALAPTTTGAIVAWSRYDGNEYRLRTARFENDRWGDEEWLGEGGSAFPSFHLDCGDDPAGPLLLFRSSSTASWSLADYSATGRLLSRTQVPTARRERPVIRLNNRRQPTLEWPQVSAARP